MTAVEEQECVRGINMRGNTQPAARGNGQFDIGELPAFIDFTTHVPLSYLTVSNVTGRVTTHPACLKNLFTLNGL